MGDAYTSIATDEYTLFYNPALLARHKGFSFASLNPSITGPNLISDSSRLDGAGDTTSGFATAAMDFPIHLGVGLAPGFKMGRFGMSAILNYETNLLLQNAVTPILKIDHRYDKGFVMGYGFPISGSYSTDGGGEHFAGGVSLKYITREAIDNSFNLTGLSLLDSLSGTDTNAILTSLGKVRGSGYGLDFGLDYANGSGANTITASLAILDIYTVLRTEENDDGYKVPAQPMKINMGSAYRVSAGSGFQLTLSADIKHLEQKNVELMRRLHVGAELGMSPLFSLYYGIQALDNFSYGFKFTAGLFKIIGGFYTNEIGEKLGQTESNEFLIYFSFFHFNFDPL